MELSPRIKSLFKLVFSIYLLCSGFCFCSQQALMYLWLVSNLVDSIAGTNFVTGRNHTKIYLKFFVFLALKDRFTFILFV